MFGSGANGSLKYNRGQRLEKRSFKDIASLYGERKRVIKDKKFTPSQFERFKIELQLKRRLERFKHGIALFVIIVAVVSVFVIVLR